MELSVLGIQENKIKQFNKKDIYSIEDLLKYIPRTYYDFREPTQIGAINMTNIDNVGMIAIVGKVVGKYVYPKTITVEVQDGTGLIYMSWFHNVNLFDKILQEGREYIFCGKPYIDTYNNRSRLKMNPILFNININKLKKIIPVYSEIKGMSKEFLENQIEESLHLVRNTRDYLSDDIKQKYDLLDEYDAFYKIHKPRNFQDVKAAKVRFAFDDLFIWNFILKSEQQQNGVSKFSVNKCKTWHTLLPMLPFELTQDQITTLKVIYSSMKSKNRLNALIQGDVGSGKTIVAEFILALCAENGFQSCLVAPLEVLARQHYKEISERFKVLGIKVGLLVGGMSTKERKEVLKEIADGTIQVIIGTHAIMGKDVCFKNLGLVCADEEHKFGVEQRNFFRKNDEYYIENLPFVAELNKVLKKRKKELASVLFRYIDLDDFDLAKEMKIQKIKYDKNSKISKEKQLEFIYNKIRNELQEVLKKQKEYSHIDDRIIKLKNELEQLLEKNKKTTAFFKELSDEDIYKLFYAYKDKILEELEKEVPIPHKITMSATPIPRTLAMGLYGDDLKIFTIKSKPNGRKPIITKVLTDDSKIDKLMLSEIKAGHQVYIVCPLIDDSECEKMTDVESVATNYNKYKDKFSKYGVNVGMVTGDMSSEESNSILKDYYDNKIQVLVSTTVIEVGVNNPNSTVMLICSSDRFGLSSLHQIRGRVGRSNLQSYCILKPNNPNDLKSEILSKTNDGFEIAKEDLKMRGTGSFTGTKQSGNDKYVSLMLEHPNMYREINKLTEHIYKTPALLSQYEFLLGATLN